MPKMICCHNTSAAVASYETNDINNPIELTNERSSLKSCDQPAGSSQHGGRNQGGRYLYDYFPA